MKRGKQKVVPITTPLEFTSSRKLEVWLPKCGPC